MVILTLLFVYPISPDEIRVGGNAESEVICCDFEEDQVEGDYPDQTGANLQENRQIHPSALPRECIRSLKILFSKLSEVRNSSNPGRQHSSKISFIAFVTLLPFPFGNSGWVSPAAFPFTVNNTQKCHQ